MKKYAWQTSFLLAALLMGSAPMQAHAQAAAGCSPDNEPWEHALAYGSLADLDRVYTQTLALPRRVGPLEQIWDRISPSTAADKNRVWRDKQKRTLITSGTCGKTPLHVAVGYGNLTAVDWLIDHGADPSGVVAAPEELVERASRRGFPAPTYGNLYSRCSSIPGSLGRATEATQHARLQAFAQTVRRGGRPSMRADGTSYAFGDEKNSMDGCFDADVLEAILSAGARASSGNLKHAVFDALTKPSKSEAQVHSATRSAEIFLAHGARPNSEVLRLLSKPTCGIPKQLAEEGAPICERLRILLGPYSDKKPSQVNVAN